MSIKTVLLNICCILSILGCDYRNSNTTAKNEFLNYDTIYHKSKNTYEIYTMSDNEKHGIMRLYDDRYGIMEEQLYLQDRLMITKLFGGDSLQAGYTYFYYKNDTMYPIGSIFFDRLSYQKVDIMCTYFEIEAPDTIEYKKPYKINIRGNYGIKNNFKISLTLGEIDSVYNLISKKATYVSEGRELEFDILDYKMGINLITGILSYYENDQDITRKYRISKIDVPLVFYKQFVAIPPAN
jgi:hypothetical protein